MTALPAQGSRPLLHAIRERYLRPRPDQAGSAVTVCIAAICGSGASIIGASDRMITGLAQYQAPEPKVFHLTSAIVAMWSGDAAFVRQILNRLRADVDVRVEAAPDDWLEVDFVAYLFQKHLNEAQDRLIEQNVLRPYGLDMANFRQQQRGMDRSLVRRLTDRIDQYRSPEVAVLIAGMDNRGAHIYECENTYSNGAVSCHDATGFAVIGSGDFHARSQLMLAGYGPSRSVDDAVLLVYLAKKRAEVAPGVGPATDMFVFGKRFPRPGFYQPMRDDVYVQLERIYTKLDRVEKKGVEKALSDMRAYGRTLRPPSPPPGQAPGGLSAIPPPPDTAPTAGASTQPSPGSDESRQPAS